MSSLEQAESILEMKNLIVENITFSRSIEHFPEKLNVNISVKYQQQDENSLKVSVSCNASDTNKYIDLSVIVSAIFLINQKVENVDTDYILKRNTATILFPYLRSEVTLVTSQPNLQPVILPPVNINDILAHPSDEVQNNDE